MTIEEQIASYKTWHLQTLLEDKEKWLFILEYCTCDTCMAAPPQQTAKWIDETREIVAVTRTELRRRDVL